MTPINPLPADVAAANDAVRPWDSLNADEKKLFSRLAEVYAGFSEYTDAQVGRIIDYLEKTDQLDNTIVFYCADNGASGEGSPNGSVNENKFFNGYPDELSENLKYLETLGGPDTYNHYPTGWAVAFSTPFQMFKRYSQYSGGTCDPLVISWPKGIKARGEVRQQYHHATDIAPTILDVVGGDEIDRNLQAVALRGTIVQVGLMGGGTVPVNVGLLMGKRATWVGTTLRTRPIEEKVAVTRRFATEMLPLFDTGAMLPVIDSVYPFERIAEAHQHMAANANTGKIVVTIGD